MSDKATLYIKIGRIEKPNQDLVITAESSDGEKWDFYEDYPFDKTGRSWNRVILSGAMRLPERHAKSWSEDGTWLRITCSDDQSPDKMLVIGGSYGTRRLSLDPRETKMPRHNGWYLYEFVCEGDSVEDVVVLLPVKDSV